MNTHEGQEFDYVVEGSMILHIDKQEVVLSAGDAVYFDAKHPHSMQAIDSQCRFLAVISK
jgi:quercetin dioxygenase-like cupin family protein